MRSQRILVVEDSRTQAAAVAAILRAEHFEVLTVSNGVAALDALDEAPFDLVLSDVQMPAMDGYELCRHIKERPGEPLPVILLTTLDSPQDVLDGLACGAQNFVSKPFDRGVLLRRLRQALGDHPEDEGADSLHFDRGQLDTLNGNGAIEYLAAAFEDYLRSRARERAATEEVRGLRRSERFLQSVLDGVSSCVGILGEDGKLVATNREWQTLQGRSILVEAEQGPGTDFLGLCQEWAEEHRCARGLAEDLPRLLDGTLKETSVECRPDCAETLRCFRIRASRLTAQGPPRVVMSFHDVTELKRAESRLQHEAYHDSLTGLPNRALFDERLERAITRAKRSQQSVAVFFCDLDRFKLVNDSLGHAAGDALLVEVSRRMVDAIRVQDSAARFGGDEFALLLEDAGDPAGIFRIAERLQASIRKPISVLGQEVYTTLSIGIAVSADGRVDPVELVRHADAAMYRAKEAGKARFCLFDDEMQLDSLAQLRLQVELRRALEHGEFSLLYQPLVAVADGRVDGVEALVRWDHPERGQVAPADFIALAEECGLIEPIGLFVLREACAQVARWRAAWGGDFPFRVNLNLSRRQLVGGEFVAAVQEALDEFDLDASMLEFELTEGTVLTTQQQVGDAVRSLRALGAGLAMDGFGTGTSSLSVLRRLPFTTLKLDASLLESMDSRPADGAVVEAVVRIGQAMGLRVVAEGVDRPGQLQLLRTMDCDLVQGFLAARPMDAEAAGALLGTNLSLPEG